MTKRAGVFLAISIFSLTMMMARLIWLETDTHDKLVNGGIACVSDVE